MIKDKIKSKWSVTVLPNPSANYFTLKVINDNLKMLTRIFVYDLFGRLLEQKEGYGLSNTRIASHYRGGKYYLKVEQGDQRKIFTLIKLGY